MNHHIEKLTLNDLEKIFSVTHTGITVDAFQTLATHWLATTQDKRFKHLYPELVYQPMLEAIHYLQENNFQVYIVSGGGQDFIRIFSQRVYDIPSERIIGTAGKTRYVDQNHQPHLIKLPSVLLLDDHQGKPEDIHLFIGKKPIIAFGNSDGDKEMLEWTQSNPKAHLMLLVHHDDTKREYAYGPESKVGTFSNALMKEANAQGWQVISMKNDWKKIFGWQ